MTANKLKTHCVHGHPFTPENTLIKKGWRECRICCNRRQAEYLRKKRDPNGWDRTKTCFNGHPRTAENTVVWMLNGKKKRRCRICAQATYARLASDTVRNVIAALHEGKTLQEIETTERIAKSSRIKAFARVQPMIGKRIYKLANRNRAARFEERRQARLTIAAPTMREPDPRAYQAVIDATRGIADPVLRGEVQQDMMLALYERRLLPKDIRARVDEFRRRQASMFSKFVPVIGGFMSSLDTKIYEDGETTLGDTVTRGLWD